MADTSRSDVRRLQRLWARAGRFGDAKPGDATPGFEAAVTGLEIVRTSPVLANGSNQVQVALAVSIQGVASATLTIEAGEPAQQPGRVNAGTVGSTVRTAQTRLYLVAEVDGTIGIRAVCVRLPIRISLATAKACLPNVTCHPAAPGTNVAKAAASSGIAEAWIGDETNNVTRADCLWVSLGGRDVAAVKALLTGVAKPLDDIVFQILSVVGVHLGAADVPVYGIRCGSSVLAQQPRQTRPRPNSLPRCSLQPTCSA